MLDDDGEVNDGEVNDDDDDGDVDDGEGDDTDEMRSGKVCWRLPNHLVQSSGQLSVNLLWRYYADGVGGWWVSFSIQKSEKSAI